MKNEIVLKSNSNKGKALLLALKFTTVFVVFRFVFELYRFSVWKERELNARMDVVVVSRKVYLIEWVEFISLIFQIALMVLCAFLFIRWMYRAYYNAIQLQFQPVSYELPWAIWGWFIPLKNTSIPHIILSEIMVTMEQVLIAEKQLVYRQKRHSIKVLWWLLLIVAMLFFSFSFVHSINGLNAIPVSLFFFAITGLLSIWMLSDLLKMEKKITELENTIVDQELNSELLDDTIE